MPVCTLIDLVYLSISKCYQLSAEAQIDRNTHYRQVKKLQKLIDENHKTSKSPTLYADLMHVSTRHLSRMSRDVLHESTSDLIAERVITETKNNVSA